MRRFSRPRNILALTNETGRRVGLVVSTLDSRSSGPGSNHRVVFLGKTLDSHSVSLHPGVQISRGDIYLGSISAALSCPVYVPPRKMPSGEERGLLSRTAASILTFTPSYFHLFIHSPVILNLMLGVLALWRLASDLGGSRNIRSRFMLQKPA